jgi:hypothetical protein
VRHLVSSIYGVWATLFMFLACLTGSDCVMAQLRTFGNFPDIFAEHLLDTKNLVYQTANDTGSM